MKKGCPKCDRVFDVKRVKNFHYKEFKKHIAKAHEPIVCELCGESFNGKPGLKNHMKNSHEENCICRYCLLFM